jgi:integrase
MGLLLFPVPDFPVPFRIRGLDYGCELLCRDLLDRTALILGFNSGMRVSEITHIDVGMIDFENERIKIWDEKKDRYRVVYPGKVAMSMISLYMKEKNIKGPRLFDLNEKTLERHFQKLTSSALNDKRSWHTVRHTYITICSRRRIDHKIIMENTGDSLQTIMRVYNNPSPEDMRINALDIGRELN